ncbi:hypothetical protein PAUR_a1625 [Pseudoalteromonas aurantia 208]|uniref:Orphan protein n=1 Tax=Pseudoalteromonas aurantia 208 TaxID=1314867 RepID=A0ABR9EBI4_9GAMM|nr:hypothetical protein [Pseudoalteromonas aurantia 208]
MWFNKAKYTRVMLTKNSVYIHYQNMRSIYTLMSARYAHSDGDKMIKSAE